MTSPILKTAFLAAAALTLAACDTAMTDTSMASAGGKTFAQMQAEYPDLSAVEFSVLDTNNDNLISASEEMEIGNDEDELEVSDS